MRNKVMNESEYVIRNSVFLLTNSFRKHELTVFCDLYDGNEFFLLIALVNGFDDRAKTNRISGNYDYYYCIRKTNP